jgi:hypothetical protein
LSIPRIDRWPFSTIMPISFADISPFIIKLRYVAPTWTRLHDMNRHDENEVKFDLIENWLF